MPMQLRRLTLKLRHEAAVLLLGALCGCTGTAPTRPDPVADAPPARFKAVAPAPDENPQPVARAQWWTVYDDPVLNGLVERANSGNTDIQIAANRLAHARAIAAQAGSARQPQAGLSAGVSRLEGPLLNAAGQEGTLLTAGATLSYEVDVLGRLSKAGEAAALDQQSRAALLDGARLITQTQVAQTYLALRFADEEAGVLRQSLAADRQTLQIQAARLQSGSISEIDFEHQRSESTAAGAQTLALQQRRTELENTLAVLVGEAPSEFQLAPAEWRATLPVLQPGVPAEVLARRPDISAAQKNVLAAQQRLGIARTAWFPGLTLSGGSGFASTDLSTLFSVSMQTWALGALATVPLLDGGRREASVAMADADLQAAAVSYRSQVLSALREVEDQISATRSLALQSDVMQRAWSSAARAANLSGTRLQSGSISQLDWLNARRSELHSRRQVVQARAAQYQASVALLRAMGGGWN